MIILLYDGLRSDTYTIIIIYRFNCVKRFCFCRLAILNPVNYICEYNFMEHKMKKSVKIILSVSAALAISLVYSASSFAGTCNKIRNDVFRLHILANSDSREDQNLKISVRDSILRSTKERLSLGSKEQAERWAVDNLGYIKEIAKEEISRQGFDYPVTVSVEDSYFSTRQYDDLTLPAGVYRSLRVEIGKGEGHNWWCVLFPQLCIPSSVDREEILESLSDDELEIIENGEKYKIGFWLLDLLSGKGRG